MVKKLKCWKKQGNLRWVNEKKQNSLQVQWFTAQPGAIVHKFDFNKPLHEGGMKQIGKDDYRSKKEATKFAESYMKKHDKC